MVDIKDHFSSAARDKYGPSVDIHNRKKPRMPKKAKRLAKLHKRAKAEKGTQSDGDSKRAIQEILAGLGK